MLSRTQIIVIGASALIALTGFAAATQWLAHIFGGQAALGHPLVIAGDASIYAPWRVMDWSKKWAHSYPRPFAIADLIIAASSVLSALILASAFSKRSRLPIFGKDSWGVPIRREPPC